jgi:hypothetical protein
MSDTQTYSDGPDFPSDQEMEAKGFQRCCGGWATPNTAAACDQEKVERRQVVTASAAEVGNTLLGTVPA